MKKLLLCSSLFTAFSFGVNAQEPEMTNRSVVWKFTETWCGPCGSWGWDLAEDIISGIEDKGYYVGVMGSSSPSSMNAMGYSSFSDNFPIGGYPTFVVNNTDGGSYMSTISPLYNAKYSAEVIASPGGSITIADGMINVEAKSKFWTATSGEFFISAYVIEDKVNAAQNGQSGTVAHHNLMRAAMTPSVWGSAITSGSVSASTEFTSTFNMAVKAGWNEANISVLLVIYKKDGTQYNVINTRLLKPVPASINNLTEVNNVKLYPNPNQGGNSNLELNLLENAKLMVKVTDITGRIVYEVGQKEYFKGNTMISLPTANLTNGIYNVTIYNGKNGMQSQSLVINR